MDQGLASSSQAVGDAQNAGDYLLEISGQVERSYRAESSDSGT
ncbi:hypothetical protein OK016_02090 [Vibrio chagasii]|nr:hypothetical protein [Vibrio chagasii]